MNYLSLIQSRFPANLETDYPIFSYMMMKYHEWLNYQYAPGNVLNDYSNLLYQEYSDSDYTSKVIADLGFDIKTGLDTDIVYQLIDNFFKSKGTVNSFKLLFKLVYGADVEITYPRDRMLYLSSANWLTTRWICITGVVELEENCIYGGIQGSTSKAIAGIESYFPLYIGNTRYYMLEISNDEHDFIVGEPIHVQYADKKYFETNIPLLKPSISGGSKYSKGDKVRVIGDYTGLYKIKNVSKGEVESLSTTASGIGYAVNDIIYTTPNNGFFARVRTVNGSGQITSTELISRGTNFQKIPLLSIKSKTGVNAKVNAVSTKIGRPLEIETSCPTVSISGTPTSVVINSTGTGATVTTIPVATLKRERWYDQKGMLGYNTLLPDSLHIHEFAYDIRTNISTNQYSDLVKEYVHPTGLTFNSINEQTTTTGKITQTNFSFTFSVGP